MHLPCAHILFFAKSPFEKIPRHSPSHPGKFDKANLPQENFGRFPTYISLENSPHISPGQSHHVPYKLSVTVQWVPIIDRLVTTLDLAGVEFFKAPECTIISRQINQITCIESVDSIQSAQIFGCLDRLSRLKAGVA